MTQISTARFICLLLPFVLLWGTVLPALVEAQYTVEPMVLDRTLDARDNVSSTITLRNTGSRLERVYATVNGVTMDGEGGIESFARRSETDNRSTVTSWLGVERGRIELPSGGTYDVSVNISIHPQAEPGIYHAFIGFASGRNRAAAEERVQAGQAPGTIVRIEVAENRTSYLRLDGFTADRFVLNPQQSQIQYSIENPGDVPHTPRGEVIIYDTRGNEVTSIPVNPDAAAVAPGETKVFSSAVPETDRMGRHRAFLALTYGEGQLASIQDTVFFFRVPVVHLILIFLVTLFIACGIAYWVHRRYLAHDHFSEDDDNVALYHRPGEQRERRDHDLDLTQTSQPDIEESDYELSK